MSPITVNPMCPEGIKSPHEEKERPSEGICEITSTQLRLRRGFKRTPAVDGRYFRDGSVAPDPAEEPTKLGGVHSQSDHTEDHKRDEGEEIAG